MGYFENSVVPLFKRDSIIDPIRFPGTCPSARFARLGAVPGYFHLPLWGLVTQLETYPFPPNTKTPPWTGGVSQTDFTSGMNFPHTAAEAGDTKEAGVGRNINVIYLHER